MPDRFDKVWYNWLDDIHDWCVSRQLWWGHRIPVYYVLMPGDTVSESSNYVVARSVEDAQVQAVEQFGQGVTVVQDDDVLDTWFRYILFY